MDLLARLNSKDSIHNRNLLIPYSIKYFAGDDLNAQTQNSQENVQPFIIVPFFEGTGDSIKLDLSRKGEIHDKCSVAEWGCLHSLL